MDQPVIGVWICDCKGLISDHLDTGRLQEQAGKLDGVSYVRRVDKLCGAAELQELERDLAAHGVGRVLFAGCSARTSLKFPQEQLSAILHRCGIDRAFLEIANIREQCAWVHADRQAATAKGSDLIRMAHARLRSCEEIPAAVPISGRALVIGGGAAGLQAARSLATVGQPVTLVEKGTYLGGKLCQIGFLFQCEGWNSYCRNECVGPVQAADVILDPNIEVLTQSEVLAIDKISGSFQARIKRGAAFVDAERCISCLACARACPEEVPSAFDLGLTRRKAIDKDFERALPDNATIIDQACTRCCECVTVCPTGAIDLEARPELRDDSFGAVFLATGFEQLDLSGLTHLGSGRDQVVTGMEAERLMDRKLLATAAGEPPERVVFTLCAGSRATGDRSGNGVPYCSKTCCAATVKQAERIIAASPETEVVIVHHRDIRVYERALEELLVRAEALGVELVNGEVEGVGEQEDGRLRITLALAEGEEPDLDDAELDGDTYHLDTDLLVLAAAQVPAGSAAPLLEQLRVLTDAHGFPMENQIRLFRPTETMVDRVFAIGAAVGPKVVQQSVEQAGAAAMKALPTLRSGLRVVGKFSSRVAGERCIRCRTCITVCPHGAIRMTAEGAVSDPAFCQACGFCAAACPTRAAQLVNFSDRQILDQAAVAFTELAPGEPKILALLCYWCSYAGGDLAGTKGFSVDCLYRSVRIRCSSSVSSGLLMAMLGMGIDGVLVAGCPERSCHHAWGNYLSDRRLALLRRLMAQTGLSEQRLRFEYIGVPQSQKFVDTIMQMDRSLRALGPNPLARRGESA